MAEEEAATWLESLILQKVNNRHHCNQQVKGKKGS